MKDGHGKSIQRKCDKFSVIEQTFQYLLANLLWLSLHETANYCVFSKVDNFGRFIYFWTHQINYRMQGLLNEFVEWRIRD